MPAREVLDVPSDASSTTSIDERLERVFAATFTDLDVAALHSASVETLEAWDSLQSVVVMTLLEEEFAVAISPLDLPQLSSFDSVREYLVAKGVGG